MLEQLEDARESLSKAVFVDPKNADAFYNLGNVAS